MSKACKTLSPSMKEHCISALNSNYYDSVTRGETLGPWACIRFESIDGTYKSGVVTVGNKSSTLTDPKNAACIESLEFGQEEGYTVRVVIHDQQGGNFDAFLEHLIKDWKDYKALPANILMKFQFGWTKSGCDSAIPHEASPSFFAYTQSIETSYSEGKFIAELTGVSTGQASREGATECLYGGDGLNEAMCLKDAITELMVNSALAPTVSDVKFIKFITGGKGNVVSWKECGFKTFHKDCGKFGGPKRKWQCNSLDKLHTVHTWLKDCPTEENKSWRVAYDPTIQGETMIIFQDEPMCDPEKLFCIGRYIVNGGKHSSVLEFNPKIKWQFASFQSVGGGSSDQRSAAIPSQPSEEGIDKPNNKTTGIVDCVNLASRAAAPGAGQMNTFITPQGMVDEFGEDATWISYINQSKHQLANMHNLYHHYIEADLVIVGDPSFVNPWLVQQKTVTIDFINPFYITKVQGIKCGEWLAKPQLNKYLSSNAWRIQRVNHSIQLGSYTTTLGLRLTKGDYAV